MKASLEKKSGGIWAFFSWCKMATLSMMQEDNRRTLSILSLCFCSRPRSTCRTFWNLFIASLRRPSGNFCTLTGRLLPPCNRSSSDADGFIVVWVVLADGWFHTVNPARHKTAVFLLSLCLVLLLLGWARYNTYLCFLHWLLLICKRN